MLLAGRLAEQELGSVIYSTYAAKSAVFLDEFQVRRLPPGRHQCYKSFFLLSSTWWKFVHMYLGKPIIYLNNSLMPSNT